MKNADTKPTFSVITVVYNGIQEIERTVTSCISQDYVAMEYLVIDGGSTDGTLEILEKYRERINVLVSEPDKGIYDAMNKGIALAKGDYVLFMNCSDRFHQPETLTQLASFLQQSAHWPDVLYGDARYIYPNVNLAYKPMPLEKMEREMAVCHQSTLVKRTLAVSRPFDLRYRLAADFDMMHAFYRQGCTFTYVPVCIADCNQEEGSTYSSYRKSTKERYSIHQDHGTLKNWLLLQKTLLRMDVVLRIKRLLPERWTQTIFNRRHKNRINS